MRGADGHGVLLSFNGPWVAPDDALTRGWSSRHPNPDTLCDRLAEDAACVELMDRLWADALAHLGGRGAPPAAASWEPSLKSESPRVHLHVFQFPDRDPGQCLRMAGTVVFCVDQRRPSFCKSTTPGRGDTRAS